MNVYELKSPGINSNSAKLRTEVAKAISHVQVVAQSYAGQKTDSADALQAFLLDAAAKLNPHVTGQPFTAVLNGQSIAIQTSAGAVSAVATVRSPGAAIVTAGGVLTAVRGAA